MYIRGLLSFLIMLFCVVAVSLFVGGCHTPFSPYLAQDKSLPRNIGIFHVINCTKKELNASSPPILQNITADIVGPSFDPDVSSALLDSISRNLSQKGYSTTIIDQEENTQDQVSSMSFGTKWKVDAVLIFKVTYWDASLIENDRILRIGAECYIIEIKTGETIWSCVARVSNIRLSQTPNSLYYKAYLERFLGRLFDSIPRM